MENHKHLFIEKEKHDFKTLNNAENLKLLSEKWGMKNLRARTWTFEGEFDNSTNVDEFMQEFARTKGIFSMPVKEAKFEPLKVSVTGKAYWKKFMKPPLAVIRDVPGHPIVKCVDKHVRSLWLCNTLQTAIFDPESDEYDIFDEDDRKELIFRLLRGCVIGGEICQFEDSFDPYDTMVINLYRDMIGKSVVRSAAGSVIVVAHAFSVTELDNLKVCLDDRSFALITIDPIERKVRMLSFNAAV